MSCLKQLFRWALSQCDHQTASMASDINFDLRIEISNLYYPGNYEHVAFNIHCGGLWGHGDLWTASMASDINFDLIFEISNLHYPGNYVHVAFNNHFGDLWGHGSLQMTSEVASDLKFVFSGLNNLCSSASLASIVLCLTNLDGSQISSIDLLASPQVKIPDT